MYFYNFNIGDYRSHTAHLTPTEHYIYRSLIDWYYLNERPLPANDDDYIAKILMLKTDDERQALQSVLTQFFKVKKLKLTGDKVECYHHARIDAEIKNYHHRNGGRVYDHTAEVTQGNETGNDGNKQGNNFGNIGNSKSNVLTQAERTKKSKADRKKIVTALKEIGVEFDSNANLKALREIHAQHFGNEILEIGKSKGNNGNSESNTFHHAITSNQEPVTNNQVNNTTQHAGEAKIFDIRTWNAPSYENALSLFYENEIYMVLPEAEYLTQVEKFKDYNANQVAQGKPSLADSSYRKSKFIDWFKILAEKQANDSAKTAKPVDYEHDDLPAIYRQPVRQNQNTGYHPSHAKSTTAKLDPTCSVMFNGLLKPLLPNMDRQQTYDYVMARQDAGESSDETYDRVANEIIAGAA